MLLLWVLTRWRLLLVPDINGKDFSGMDLRRSNFTSATAKNANFKGAKLEGSYFIKAVVYQVTMPSFLET